MALKIDCTMCDKELDEPGAIVLTPPEYNVVKKLHLCTTCSAEVLLFIHDPYSFQYAEVDL